MKFGVLTAFVQAIMSSQFMPFPLAQVKNGDEHSYEQNSYLIDEMPQDALKIGLVGWMDGWDFFDKSA
jgi:hypothetical protein